MRKRIIEDDDLKPNDLFTITKLAYKMSRPNFQPIEHGWKLLRLKYKYK